MSMRWGRMSHRMGLWVAALVVGSALSVTAPTVADAGKNHGKARYCREHGHSERHWKRHRQAKRAPRVVYQQRCYVPNPVRTVASVPVAYYHDRPFYFYGGLNVFFDTGVFSISVGPVPPRGYAYYDPYCHTTMGSVAAYHSHLRDHHHRPLMEVVYIGGGGPYCR